MMPKQFKIKRKTVFLLLLVFSFIAPVVGVLGLLLITHLTLRLEASRHHFALPQQVSLPIYDVQTKTISRSGQGAIRSRLDAHVPGDIRMRSLLTLQNVPTQVANPILEDLLGDSSDDVRLVAFGMLDAEEKKVSRFIQHELDVLHHANRPDHRYDSLRHLAELHWEMIYASLAQGDLRHHHLGQASQYIEQAIDLGFPADAGLLFLRGRILLAQGSTDLAEQSIRQALSLGQSPTSALPYMAELAFRRQDYALVKHFMTQLSALSLASKTRAIADLWTGLDNISNFSDRRFLPHI